MASAKSESVFLARMRSACTKSQDATKQRESKISRTTLGSKRRPFCNAIRKVFVEFDVPWKSPRHFDMMLSYKVRYFSTKISLE